MNAGLAIAASGSWATRFWTGPSRTARPARIRGGLHGPGHAEAAGVVEQSDILGAFGTTRQQAHGPGIAGAAARQKRPPRASSRSAATRASATGIPACGY